MKRTLFIVITALSTVVMAQLPSTDSAVLTSLEYQQSLKENSRVKNLEFSSIGPTVMSGRVVDVAVNKDNPSEFFVAYASGGLWYTNNNGTSFESIMDNAPTQNIGDIAVDWPTGTLWVGTGENNSSRSSYAGIGILKSTDHGKTWEHMGLEDSHHIGRILINPHNPNEVIVGVLGHLYSENEQRGIYKTTDGGQTWKKTLSISTNTGIIDLASAPENFEVMYASSWQKERKAWNFKGNGSNSGIYKSQDAGESWKLVSTPASGFPSGAGTGRIGLAVYDAQTIYAIHDNQFHQQGKEDSDETNGSLKKDDFKTMTSSEVLALADGALNTYLRSNNFPKKYDAKSVKALISDHKAKASDLALYLEDANTNLFETPIVGAEVLLSTDGGITWTKQNKEPIEGLFYTYGYYFAQIAVSKTNKEQLVVAGVPLLASSDGGKTFYNISGDNMHSDHHALWIDPANDKHIINGNDGGINITYDGGSHWLKCNTPAVGQFYFITTDHEKPYNIYGGLQDNGVWKGAHNAPISTSWHSNGNYPWKSILGGDGMQVQVDSRDSNIVYTGYQFGNYFRIDLKSNEYKAIQPKHDLGESPLRFNWQTPILLSKHHQDILYLGSNKLHRSLDGGSHWETLSGDLTRGGKKGTVPYGTLTVIEESPFTFGKLYVGSDDGMIYRTDDGGVNWKLITNGLPSEQWVSSIYASTHQQGRVYMSLNSYRSDHFNAYIYASEDSGSNWNLISASLPLGAVNSVIEDPMNEEILYAGTDNGAYVSFDRGLSWEAFNIPAVAVHDVVVQKDAKHLLLGTHGRSIYKADLSKLQLMDKELRAKELHLFDLDSIKYSSRWGNKRTSWSKTFTPVLEASFYLKKQGKVTIEVQHIKGITVYTTSVSADTGLNTYTYDVSFSKEGLAAYLSEFKQELKRADNEAYYLPKGTYKMRITHELSSQEQEFKIE